MLLACFGDPGLDALREVAPIPVVGLADAAGEAAIRLGRRFGVVTGGAAWAPMLTEFYAARGLADRLAGCAPSRRPALRSPQTPKPHWRSSQPPAATAWRMTGRR